MRIAALLLLLLVGASPAAADYEATEARLKNAGIDEELREEIHGAIRRGVRWLLSAQRDDGGFDGHVHSTNPNVKFEGPADPGHSILCTLALRHAGTKPALIGVRRAKRYLFPKGDLRSEIVHQTYHAGIASMFAAAEGGHEDAAKVLAARLVRTGRRGTWGYGSARSANLSTAQFGALGLWACERAGANVPPKAWEAVAKTQVRTEQRGRWGYWPDRKRTDYRTMAAEYPQGTFMGLANLLLAEAALERSDRPRKSLLAKVASAKARALEALAEDGPAFLERFRDEKPPMPDRSWKSFYPYYALYALEKVCIFADLEEVGGVRWYEVGARALLKRQNESGSWGRVPLPNQDPMKSISAWAEPESVATSFALLFLLRASETYHPVTPRPVDGPQRPRAVVTPR